MLSVVKNMCPILSSERENAELKISSTVKNSRVKINSVSKFAFKGRSQSGELGTRKFSDWKFIQTLLRWVLNVIWILSRQIRSAERVIPSGLNVRISYFPYRWIHFIQVSWEKPNWVHSGHFSQPTFQHDIQQIVKKNEIWNISRGSSNDTESSSCNCTIFRQLFFSLACFVCLTHPRIIHSIFGMNF